VTSIKNEKRREFQKKKGGISYEREKGEESGDLESTWGQRIDGGRRGGGGRVGRGRLRDSHGA